MIGTQQERRRRDFAGIWSHNTCAWCGQPSNTFGLYLDMNSNEVVIRQACEAHTEDLISLIDGLTDGRLVASWSGPKEEMN